MTSSVRAAIKWLNSGGVVLGLAISVYTIYSFVDARITQNRQQYALLKQIDHESKYFITLAQALKGRAQQVEKLYADSLKQPSFPEPAQDKDSLPEDAERVSRWLAARANHLAEYRIPIEIDKVGAILDRKQADALFDLLAAQRIYVQVLRTRTVDLEAFPRRPGVLKRFVGVAVLNTEPMAEKLATFAASLGIPTPAQKAGSAETPEPDSSRPIQ